MGSLWSFIAKPKNRQMLSWVGGGIVAVAVGAWAVVTHFWPVHGSTKKQQVVAIRAMQLGLLYCLV